MSSAYIGNEMRNEFGMLPPAFLPYGPNCAYERLREIYDISGPLFLTLPKDFQISRFDQSRLAELNITIIELDQSLSLPNAMAQALDAINADEPLTVIFGDTDIGITAKDRQRTDVVAVSHTSVNHIWTYVDTDGTFISKSTAQDVSNLTGVVCGYFCFSDKHTLKQALTQTETFEGALNRYKQVVGLDVIEPKEWRDFGHLTTFFQSRKKLLVSRVFNEIEVQDDVVIKRSLDHKKLKAEYDWYTNLPPKLRLHTPRLMGFKQGSDDNPSRYSIEYLYLMSLSELFVFGTLPRLRWRRIMRSTGDILQLLQDSPADLPEGQLSQDEIHKSLFETKTWARLEAFEVAPAFPPEAELIVNGKTFPNIHVIAEETIKILSQSDKGHVCLSHGDFFFGNMLFDSRSERTVMIDPRGFVEGDFTQWGSQLYDIAKLCHSTYGNYDAIIANRYNLTFKSITDLDLDVHIRSDTKMIRNLFDCEILNRFNVERQVVLAATVLLFLSMLPLHSESPMRQYALVATAVSLYSELENA
jgi:hypothetical protein